MPGPPLPPPPPPIASPPNLAGRAHSTSVSEALSTARELVAPDALELEGADNVAGEPGIDEVRSRFDSEREPVAVQEPVAVEDVQGETATIGRDGVTASWYDSAQAALRRQGDGAPTAGDVNAQSVALLDRDGVGLRVGYATAPVVAGNGLDVGAVVRADERVFGAPLNSYSLRAKGRLAGRPGPKRCRARRAW